MGGQEWRSPDGSAIMTAYCIVCGNAGVRFTMSKQEYEIEAAALRAAAERVCASPESARKFLVDAGIYTESGELTEAYR